MYSVRRYSKAILPCSWTNLVFISFIVLVRTKICDQPKFQHSHQRLINLRQRRQKLVKTKKGDCLNFQHSYQELLFSLRQRRQKLVKTKIGDQPDFQHSYQELLFNPRQQHKKLVKTMYIKAIFYCVCNNFQLKLVLV